MASLGSLVVSLGLNASEFTSGLSKSEYQAKQFAGTIDKAVAAGVIKAELAIRALGMAAKATFATFQSLTTGAAQFQDLAETTGAAAEDLAGLAVAAATAGVEMDSVGGAANRLTKGLVGVDDESKAAGAALKALNINVGDFKALDPVAQYEAVGRALGGFADGAGKVAVAQALFGKRGAEQLRVFAALEEAGGRQNILTIRQIQLADQFQDQQAKSTAQLRLYLQAAASEAVPALTALTKAFNDTAKAALGVDNETGKIAANNGVRTFAEKAAVAIAQLVSNLTLAGKTLYALGGSFQSVAADAALLVTALDRTGPRGMLSGGIFNEENRNAIKAAFDERQKVASDANQRYIDLFEFDRKRLAKSVQGFIDQGRLDAIQQDPRELARRGRVVGGPDKPLLRYNGPPDASKADAAAALFKKELDGEIKAIRDFAEQQRDALDFANKYAKGAYDQGEIDLVRFFENERQIRAAALQVALSAIDQEVAALQRAAGRKGAKPEERVDAENKIAEAVAKRAAAVQKAGYDTALAAQEEASSLSQLRGRYDDLRMTIMQLSGDTAGAARKRIDQQVAEAQRVTKQVGGDPSEVERYRTLPTDTEALSKARQDYNRLLETSRNTEEAAYLSAQEGGKSEIETLRALGGVRSSALAQMATMVERANELAASLRTDDAKQYAEQLAAAFKRASAEVDPLLMKIRDVGEEAASAIAGGLEDAVLSGKNLRDTLQDIDKALAQIIIRQAVTKPFEQWLGNQIGGNGQASGGGGWIGAAGSFIASMFGGGGGTNGFGIGVSGAAIGGPIMPRSIRRVGENGPEVFNDGSKQYMINGPRGGSMNPSPNFGSRTINAPINITVPGNTNRSTASQIGAEVSRQLAAVNRRDN